MLLCSKFGFHHLILNIHVATYPYIHTYIHTYIHIGAFLHRPPLRCEMEDSLRADAWALSILNSAEHFGRRLGRRRWIYIYIYIFIYLFVYTLRYIYIHTHTHTHIYIYIHILVPMDGVSVVFIVWLWLLHPSALSGTTSSFGWPGIKEDIAARKTLPSGTLMETCLSLRSAWGDVVGWKNKTPISVGRPSYSCEGFSI